MIDWYIASPYSDPDPRIVEKRFLDVREFTVQSLRRGHICFSPIVFCHQMSQKYALPGDATYWSRFNKRYLIASRSLVVLQLEGWENSVGVKQEIEWAKLLEKEIIWMAWRQ